MNQPNENGIILVTLVGFLGRENPTFTELEAISGSWKIIETAARAPKQLAQALKFQSFSSKEFVAPDAKYQYTDA